MFNFLALLDIRDFGRLLAIVASDWPRTFFTARLFLFSIYLATYREHKHKLPNNRTKKQSDFSLLKIPYRTHSRLNMTSRLC